jgi:phosphatidylglycerophosphatase A
LVPLLLLSLFNSGKSSGYISIFLFILASISDYFDGYCARKWNLQSKLGEFIDPLADKILVGSLFVSFVFLPYLFVPFWLVAVILFREVTLTVLRIISVRSHKPLKTEYSGKVKTAFQMFSVFCILGLVLVIKCFLSEESLMISGSQVSILNFWKGLVGIRYGIFIYYLPLSLVSISAFLALFSMVHYFVSNRWIILSTNRKKYIEVSIKIITTGFYTGYFPFASGTFGSLIGIILWIFTSEFYLFYIITAIFILLGISLAGYAEHHIFQKKDSSKIVIDEISGMLVTYLSFQFTRDISGIVYLVIGFLLFRFFDIIKPWPIKNVQKYRGGFGIMMDDIFSGIFANSLLQILRFFIFIVTRQQ